MTHPFLKFRVGVGQRRFRIKGVKCVGGKSVPSNFFRIAGTPVDRSSDKQVWLISLSNCIRKNIFQVILAFGHSTFITLQSLFVPTNMVLKRYLACRTFSKCQSYSQSRIKG